MKLTLPEKLFLLEDAYIEARKSPDPSSQNGAVLLDKEYRPIAYAYNGPLPGTVLTEDEIKNRDIKLFNFEHAERMAIYKAARSGYRTAGTTLVCPWFACADCARCIIACGIKHVIGHKQHMDDTPDRWKLSIEAAFKMLDDAGATYEFVDAKIGCKPVLFNGELWYP